MLISMWMIRDMLGDKVTQTHISDGGMSIRSISLLAQSRTTQKKTAYICPSEQFIPTMRRQVICVHGDDWIVVDSDDFEEVFDFVSSRVEQIFDWDQDVRDAIAGGCSLASVAERATDMLGNVASVINSLFMMEAHGRLQGTDIPRKVADQIEREGTMSLGETVEFSQDYALFSTRRTVFPYYLKRYGNVGCLCKSLFAEGAFWGACMLYIGASPASQIPRSTLQLFEVFHEQVAYWLASQGLIGQAPTHNRMVSALLEGAVPAAKVEGYLEGLGWGEGCEKYVAILKLADDNPSIHRIVGRHLDRLHPKVVHSSRGDAFTVIGNSEAMTDEALLSGMRPMMQRYDVRAGVSFPVKEAGHFKSAYRQAELALEHAGTSDTGVCRCLDNAVTILGELLDPDSSPCLRHPAISQIQSYDETHGTELIATLCSYLLNERSLVRTAAELNVHKNTVKYRVGVLAETFGLDLDDRDQRLHLLVSLALEL